MMMLLPSNLQHCTGAYWSWWLGVLVSAMKLPSLAVLLLGVAVNFTIAISHTAG